ncbi:hypothetical protein [Homoserinibacter sp. GY 40078]|uniref:DsbA family protein n=1 Tax=Homoserinibacter sp. GY 40078 TaxID=2603275 RepID=UPI0011C8D839|nr:hypothetical protein [Homoserinibacter sp. GY 40078]TXK17432.1 hypothetical protein FVQ89_11410 [Homoserinibacter sp. GY 40078]
MPERETPLSRKQRRKLSKREQIQRSREGAAIKRARLRRQRIRNRILLISGVAAATALIAVAGTAAVNANAREAAAGPENMASDGILFTGDGTTASVVSTARLEAGESPHPTAIDETDGIPALTLYVDFADKDSATLISTISDTLTQWLDAGYLSFEIHPVAMIDTAPADDYSIRSANLIACMAQYQPDGVLDVVTALASARLEDAYQPLTDDELVMLVRNAGYVDDDLESCITSVRFRQWVEKATSRVTEGGVPLSDVGTLESTPLLLGDRTAYTGEVDDADAFSSFVVEVYESEAGTTDDAE